MSARRDSAWYVATRWVARHRSAVALAAVVLLAVGASAIVSVRQAREAREQSRIATIEATTAAAVQDFLEGILRAGDGAQTDPIKARQRTVNELVDAASAQVGTSLQGQPAAKQRVLRTLAEVYESIGRGDEAANLRGQRAAVLEASEGPAAEATLMAWAEWADALVYASREDEAMRLLARADSVSAGRPIGPDARLKLDLARANLLATGLRDGALEPAQRAVSALLAKPPSRDLLRAMDLLAMAHMSLGQMAESRQTLQRAIELARGMAGAGRQALVILLGSQGDIAIRMDQSEAALASYREAVATADAHAGAASPLAAIARFNLALGLGSVDQPLAGQAIMEQALGIVEGWPSSSPERTQYQPMYTLRLATLLRRAGRPAQALQRLEASTVLLERADALPSFAALWRIERSLVLVDLGRLADSARDLAAARAQVQRMSGDPALRHMLDSAAVRLALAERRPQAAQEHWQRLNAANDRSLRRRLAIDAAHVEMLLLERRCDDGERVAQQTLTELETQPSFQRSSRAQLEALIGYSRLCAGQHAQAVEPLGSALRSWSQIEDAATSPRVAQVRAALMEAQARSRVRTGPRRE